MAGPRHFIDYFTLLPPPDAKKKDTFILGFVVFALTLRNDTCTNVEKVHYSLQERVVLLQAMLSICVSNRVQHSLKHSPYHATLYIYICFFLKNIVHIIILLEAQICKMGVG